MRVLIMLYAVFSYAAFAGVTAWFAIFVMDLFAIRSSAALLPWPTAVAIDVALVTFFGVTHSVMARPSFKRVWTRIIPPAAERATYVLVSSAQLAMIFHLWKPINVTIWQLDGVPALIAYGGFAVGLIFVVLATFLLDHFEFTGLQQAWNNMRDTQAPDARFRTPLLYRMVRHPLQLGIVMTLFFVPTMTVDGLLFAVVMLAYILIGLRFEERALHREFGPAYAEYCRRVPLLFPSLPWSARRIGRHQST